MIGAVNEYFVEIRTAISRLINLHVLAEPGQKRSRTDVFIPGPRRVSSQSAGSSVDPPGSSVDAPGSSVDVGNNQEVITECVVFNSGELLWSFRESDVQIWNNNYNWENGKLKCTQSEVW